LPYLFTHSINEGSLRDRLLLVYYVNMVTKPIFFIFTKRKHADQA